MSYCRPGEESDVYVWSNGETLYCEAPTPREFSIRQFSTTSRQDMIEHLLSHRRRGQKVPETALERLAAERDGVPYETDVERVLKEARGLNG